MKYVIVRSQYIDPFDHSLGFYVNENQALPKVYDSKVKCKKDLSSFTKKEGKCAKYAFFVLGEI